MTILGIAWVQILALPIMNSVALGKVLNIFAF